VALKPVVVSQPVRGGEWLAQQSAQVFGQHSRKGTAPACDEREIFNVMN
jgi:hypothetical protein